MPSAGGCWSRISLIVALFSVFFFMLAGLRIHCAQQTPFFFSAASVGVMRQPRAGCAEQAGARAAPPLAELDQPPLHLAHECHRHAQRPRRAGGTGLLRVAVCGNRVCFLGLRCVFLPLVFYSNHALLHLLHQLQTLRFASCFYMDDRLLDQVCSLCPNLRELNLQQCM